MSAHVATVELPEELIHEIDSLVGSDSRNAFLVETAQAELRRRRLLEFLRSDEGIDEDAHPEWKDPAAWVQALRREKRQAHSSNRIGERSRLILLLDTTVLIDALKPRAPRRALLATLMNQGHRLTTAAVNVCGGVCGYPARRTYGSRESFRKPALLSNDRIDRPPCRADEERPRSFGSDLLSDRHDGGSYSPGT